MQENWLGRSLGANISFPLVRKDIHPDGGEAGVTVFTTRPETLTAVKFIAVSPSHHIVKAALKNIDSALQAFLDTLPSLPPDTKKGYKLYKGYNVCHPLDPNVEIPVFVAPYVLDNYGEGAVMGVPGHDQRDFEFWKENYRALGETEEFSVLAAVNDDSITMPELKQSLTNPEGTLTDLAGDLEGKPVSEGVEAILQQLVNKKLGGSKATYRLRDWLISRQRHWGAPIPMVHCTYCGTVPVPEEQLPVLLPENVELKGKGSILKDHPWVHVDCP
jgi:leucyl-tRNA synthetase